MFDTSAPAVVMPTTTAPGSMNPIRALVHRPNRVSAANAASPGASESGYNKTDVPTHYIPPRIRRPRTRFQNADSPTTLVIHPMQPPGPDGRSPVACANPPPLDREGRQGESLLRSHPLHPLADASPAKPKIATVKSTWFHTGNVIPLLRLSATLSPHARRFESDPAFRARDLLLPAKKTRAQNSLDLPHPRRSLRGSRRRARQRPCHSASSPLPTPPPPSPPALSNAVTTCSSLAAGGVYSLWLDLAVTRLH